MYSYDHTIKLIVFGMLIILVGGYFFFSDRERSRVVLKKYGPLVLSIFNTLLWWWIYLADFYYLEFHMTFGAGIVSMACIIWGKREKQARFRIILFSLNGLFLTAYIGFWYYVYQLGKAWSI